MTWIFGYGSLIWRPGFPYLERRKARLARFQRRFWQGSPDHRGTPDAPGRVVTLVPDRDGHCEGVVFRIDQSARDEIITQLDIREAGGYTRTRQPVLDDRGETLTAIVYVANEQNPYFLGSAGDDEMVAHIMSSTGPSGPNVEYVINLADALRHESIPDSHVENLAALLRDRVGA